MGQNFKEREAGGARMIEFSFGHVEYDVLIENPTGVECLMDHCIEVLSGEV